MVFLTCEVLGDFVLRDGMYLIVLDIVSEVSMYRNIELRYIGISSFFCPSSRGVLVFYLQLLSESFDVSNIELVSISFFAYWYCIELDSDIGIVSNSIPLSVSYRTRFRYRYLIELDPDIGVVSISKTNNIAHITQRSHASGTVLDIVSKVSLLELYRYIEIP